MKKIKRYVDNIINNIKSMRISTIYKLIGLVLFIGILIWVFSTWKKENNLLNSNKNNVILTGTITNKGDNYIIVEDKSNNEYLIKGVDESDYTIGSDVNANVGEVIEDGNMETPTTITSNGIDVTNNKKENKNADEEVIAYMNDTENYFNDINYKEEIKVRFIAIVDFLFYNGKIKGYTLNDLSSSAKLKAMKIALAIDAKIENYLPGYKETISTTSNKIYTGLKTKIIEQYLSLTTKICNYDQNLCDSATTDFQEMKKAFSITWSTIKDIISSGTENLKDWYEIFSGKTT